MNPRRGISAALGRGFTLIELVVVIILLGVLAGLLAPRVLSGGKRAAENEVDSVLALLAIFAERHATGGEPVALEASGTGTLGLLVRRIPDPAARNQEPEWKVDPLVEPATLTVLKLERATIDGRGLPSGRPWRLVAVPAAAMPAIELELVMPDADPAVRWRIALADGASAPVVLGAGAAPETQVIDLDAAGRAEQEW